MSDIAERLRQSGSRSEIVERLRESGLRSEIELHEDREEAATRIEELEKDVRKWQAKHDTWRAMALSAETNLEVAVGSLKRIELSTDTREQGAIAMATLAELKGKDDE